MWRFFCRIFIFSFFCIEFLTARIEFIHIPKCGGTTIHSMLEKYFFLEDIYPYGVWYLIPPGKEKIDHQLVSGQFPFWFLEANDQFFSNSFKFTVLRQPIERVISEYEYKIRHKINQNILDVPANYMCKNLCSDPLLEGEFLLEDCKKNLDRLDLVIFLEDFEKGVAELFDLLSLPLLEEKVPKLNAALRKGTYPQEIIDKIAEMNDLDIRLYEYAKGKCKNNGRKYKGEIASLKYLYKPKKEIFFSFDMPSLQKGWGHRENIGTSYSIYQWVLGKKAVIYFMLEPGQGYEIEFSAYCLKPFTDPQLFVNGRKIHLQKLTDGYFASYQGKISPDILSDKLTEVVFTHSQPLRFNEVYPDAVDDRVVSIAVNRIQIRPLYRS